MAPESSAPPWLESEAPQEEEPPPTQAPPGEPAGAESGDDVEPGSTGGGDPAPGPSEEDGEQKVDLAAALLAPELTLGSTPKALAANAAVKALARASRAYLVYDAKNAAIRAFLAKLKDDFEAYLGTYGDMILVVRPYELVLEKETVYIERDWERSLAFKLFRDGVRKLTVRAGVTWDELTQLLGILSIRFVGVRLDEDDVLTLLWKAAFRSIEVEAVEGFVPADDEDADALGFGVGQLGVAAGLDEGAKKAPADFDLPAPELYDLVEVEWKEVPAERLAELRGELASTHLMGHVMTLGHELLKASLDPTDPLDFYDTRHFMKEVREFLLSEDALGELLDLAEMVHEYGDVAELSDRSRASLNDLLAGFTDHRALRKLFHTVPREATEPPPEFARLLAMHPGDPVPALIDVMEEEREAHIRGFSRRLVESFLPERADTVIERYRTAPDSLAADLLRCLSARAPEAAEGLFQDLVTSGSRAVKMEFLSQVESAAVSGHLRLFLVQLLNAPEEAVRIRALDVVGKTGEKGAYPNMLRHADRSVKLLRDDRELESIGRTLARLNPDPAVPKLIEWALPKGLIKRLNPMTQRYRRMGVAGLVILADRDDVEEPLKQIVEGKDESLARIAREALRRRGRLRHSLQEPGATGRHPTRQDGGDR